MFNKSRFERIERAIKTIELNLEGYGLYVWHTDPLLDAKRFPPTNGSVGREMKKIEDKLDMLIDHLGLVVKHEPANIRLVKAEKDTQE